MKFTYTLFALLAASAIAHPIVDSNFKASSLETRSKVTNGESLTSPVRRSLAARFFNDIPFFGSMMGGGGGGSGGMIPGFGPPPPPPPPPPPARVPEAQDPPAEVSISRPPGMDDD
ncbi:hypothetical protein TWF694_001422 [Orbilia ellipsospora]|uniref:Uncharacterized protein n=1 Tax=Orbilia ellipsospora TaxID=2528407 RepID=A0AAV9XT58_9PEZI